MDDLLEGLNPAQQSAVSSEAQHILVLAGAGSGKTRVLTHRIAWLIQEGRTSAYAVLAVTFTNKAAAEMRARLEQLLHTSAHSLWIGTFHGLAHRLLRLHHTEARLPADFQILDTDDQQRMIKRLMKEAGLDDTRFPPKQVMSYINQQKERGRRAPEAKMAATDYFAMQMNQIYEAYETLCTRSGLVDFSELLLRSVELLEQNPTIQAHYYTRFQHILVDEFQDTNAMQHRWLKLLKAPETALLAVGDDDQSIYSWRGAQVDHIHRFEREFTKSQIIRLEQNYRSTQTILDAANAVISHNTHRLGKSLWTEGEVGTPIQVYPALNERDEAHFIADQIRCWRDAGRSPAEVAILYRSNAQSRVLEERLLETQIPYRIYGGFKFFERAEIRDALAYLRLLYNPDDDAAFERIVNVPPRGIGAQTLMQLRESAHATQRSLWQATLALRSEPRTRGNAALLAFVDLMATLKELTESVSLADSAQVILEKSGLWAFYEAEKSDKGISRAENLEELITALAEFKTESEEMSPFQAFLAHVTLDSGSEGDDPTESVSLMTLHSAKGLEFPFVILVGLEEGLFPHQMSFENPAQLEEERRLCYVGMTRAREKLLLTYAEQRTVYGSQRQAHPSRFLQEIPTELLEYVRRLSFARSHYAERAIPRAPKPVESTQINSTLQIGKRVSHPRFGTGVLLAAEGSGTRMQVQVRFERYGTKWLMLESAPLTPVE